MSSKKSGSGPKRKINGSPGFRRPQPMSYNIEVENLQRDLPLRKGKVRLFLEEVLRFLDVSRKNLFVYFVSKKRISALHKDFFQDPTATDCISFPMDGDELGEIFVCPKVAIEYGRRKNLDPYQETKLYLIHAALHLLGYDDIEVKDRRIMRKMEKKCMDQTKNLSIG